MIMNKQQVYISQTILYLGLFLLGAFIFKMCGSPKAVDPEIKIETITTIDTLWIKQPPVTHIRYITEPGRTISFRDTLLIPGQGLVDTVLEAQEYNETWSDTNGKFEITSTVKGSLLKQSLKYELVPRPVITKEVLTTKTITIPPPRFAAYVGVIADPFQKRAYVKTDLVVDKFMFTVGLGVGLPEGLSQQPGMLAGLSYRLFKR